MKLPFSNENINTGFEKLQSIINEQASEIFKLKNIIENLPGSVYWKDLDGAYLGRNFYAFQKMVSTGLERNSSQDSAIGKTDYDYFPEMFADEYRKNDLEVINNEHEIMKEEKLTLPNGKTLVQLSCKKPLRDKQGRIIGIIGNTIDITYFKKFATDEIVAQEFQDIKPDAVFQVREKDSGHIVRLSAQEIFYNDELLEKFKPKDIRTIVYFAAMELFAAEKGLLKDRDI